MSLPSALAAAPPIAAVLPALEGADEASAWLGVTILAVIQGLTEFLPVSSSGHLSLAGALLERSDRTVPEAGLALTVVLHVGTLVAVAWVYGRDLVRMGTDALAGRPRTLLLVALGSVPAAVVGLAFEERFEALAEDPTAAAVCLLVTAALLVAGERDRRARGDRGAEGRAIGVVDALVIGCAQALAILPGVSRSGATIATGLLRGLDGREAARFSFMLGFVAILGAAVLEVPDALTAEGTSLARLAAGFAVSAVVGVGALRLLLVTLSKGAFLWFALYCAAVGLGWLLFLD